MYNVTHFLNTFLGLDKEVNQNFEGKKYRSI